MPTVHLTRPDSASPSPARVLPGRLDLTLGQLLLLAHRAGDVPLPLDLPTGLADGAAAADALHDRLSGGTAAPADLARQVLLAEAGRASGDDPASLAELARLRAVDDAGSPAGEVVAALRCLAAPEVLLVLDLVVDGRRLRSWIAVGGGQVAQLSTSSGVAVELAWTDVRDLPDVLARAVLVESAAPRDDEPTEPVPERFAVPFELYTQGTEAARLGRPEVLAEMVAQATGPVEVDGERVDATATASLLRSVSARTRGRLRLLITVPDPTGSRRQVGVVAWSRFDDDWWALTPVTRAGVPTVVAHRAGARDLGTAVAPILAEVLR